MSNSKFVVLGTSMVIGTLIVLIPLPELYQACILSFLLGANISTILEVDDRGY